MTKVDIIYSNLIDCLKLLPIQCPALKGEVFPLTASFYHTCQTMMDGSSSSDYQKGNPHVPFIISREICAAFDRNKRDVWMTVHAESMLVTISDAMLKGLPISHHTLADCEDYDKGSSRLTTRIMRMADVCISAAARMLNPLIHEQTAKTPL